MINYAVVLSAGFGTRFLPYTKAVPKPMLPLLDTPAIEYIIKEVVECGIENIIVVVGHNQEIIKKHFSKNDYLDILKISEKTKEKIYFSENIKLQFVTQNLINGTASAILSAQKLIGNHDFLVLNADEIFIKNNEYEKCASKQLIDLYENTNCNIIGIQKVTKEEAKNLGVVVGKKINEGTILLDEIIEKPKNVDISTPYVNVGRYVVKNKIFDYLKNVKPNKTNEYALTDALVDYSKFEKILCYDFVGKHFNIGNKLSYMKTIFDFSINDKEFGNDFKEYILNYIKK